MSALDALLPPAGSMGRPTTDPAAWREIFDRVQEMTDAELSAAIKQLEPHTLARRIVPARWWAPAPTPEHPDAVFVAAFWESRDAVHGAVHLDGFGGPLPQLLPNPYDSRHPIRVTPKTPTRKYHR